MKLILLVFFTFIGLPMTLFTLVPTIPDVDLAIVSATANIKHGHVGQYATFTIKAINKGPDIAPTLDVYFTINLRGIQIIKPICDLGVSADGIVCEYHDIKSGQVLTTIIIIRLIKSGIANLTTCVRSEGIINDPHPNNDCVKTTIKVTHKK